MINDETSEVEDSAEAGAESATAESPPDAGSEASSSADSAESAENAENTKSTDAQTDTAESGENQGTGGEETVPLKSLADGGAGAPVTKPPMKLPEGVTGEIDIAALMDVPVTLSVEIGKKRMPIQELVDLTPGSVVELDKDHSAPLDLLVNGTLIARGEVVVVGKRFGLRLVDVVSPKERIQRLK